MSLYSPPSTRFLKCGQAHSNTTLSQTSDYFSQSTQSTFGIKSPQLELLRRWQEMSTELVGTRLSRTVLISLHRCLDEAERWLSTNPPEKANDDREVYELGIATYKPDNTPMPPSPTIPPQSPKLHTPDRKEATVIAAHAPEMDEELLDRITLAAEELLQRQLEYKQLHSVATANEEAAAEKIRQLESEIEDLEKDVADDQTELTYLKLNLRILEIQTLPYVPAPEKDSLSRGIKVWKQDWADVENRFRVRWKHKGTGKGAKGKQECTLSAKYGI